ncbi:hypothetical protein Tco_0346778, partial [Tanacetum coccineum]
LSSNKYWIPRVDQINHRSSGVDNDSSLSVYLIHALVSLVNPLSESSCNYSDNSFISDGTNRYGAQATGVAPGIKSIWNSTG